ncbi:Hexosaminidase D [Armadillidium vulgare]|nr:Hexosaminidase D [Armadillidium vulgare]
MGKKRNAKRNGLTKNTPYKLLPQIRSELTDIVDQLFKKCTKVPTPASSPSQEWEKFLQIYQLVEKIREIEKDIVLPSYDREEQAESFLQWLKENDAEVDGVEIYSFEQEGLGLKTTKALQEGDLVLSIPKKLVMSEETARKSYLGSLIEKDPILHHMGNVSLSLHLLGEYVTKQFQNIARQYSYFYRIFHSLPEARSWPIRDYFTFDSYRWAVSIVMTRLNRIPAPDSIGQLGLIPGWDMANHEHGVFSTDFDETKDSITCFAHRNFACSEQFCIYYGQRSNAEFFLHSGFVYKDNPSDTYALKLGVSKSDPLYEEKSNFLSSVSLSVNGSFPLVQEAFVGERRTEKLIACDANCNMGASFDEKVDTFLHTRVSLLLKSYPTSLEEDLEALKTCSGFERLIRSLLIEEKKMLKASLIYLSAKLPKK